MQTDFRRRTILKGTLAASVASIAAGAGLLTPTAVLAAWPQAAFEAKGMDNATKALFGSSGLTGSKDIKIKAPPIAENGAVVNVAIESSLPNVESMSLFVEKNNSPLAVSFNLSSTANAFVKTRVKVAKSSQIIAVVKSDGKLYSAGREVKVTLGGCGG
jgi:sulfur-oxidizing protein SoxY